MGVGPIRSGLQNQKLNVIKWGKENPREKQWKKEETKN